MVKHLFHVTKKILVLYDAKFTSFDILEAYRLVLSTNNGTKEYFNSGNSDRMVCLKIKLSK
jgi:hypothetical protein